jgi:hypothetical protein
MPCSQGPLEPIEPASHESAALQNFNSAYFSCGVIHAFSPGAEPACVRAHFVYGGIALDVAHARHLQKTTAVALHQKAIPSSFFTPLPASIDSDQWIF